MGFFSVYPFVGFAKGAEVLLDVLHEVKEHTLLVMTGMKADRAVFTDLCKGFVQDRRFRAFHIA